jgi:hypothetical protein
MLRLRSATGIKLRMTNYFKIPKSEASHEINSPLKREVGGVSAVQTPIAGHFDSAQCPETRPFIHHSSFIIHHSVGVGLAVHSSITGVSIQFFAWSPSGFPEADTQTGVMIHYFKRLLEKRIEVQAKKNHSRSGALQSPITNHQSPITNHQSPIANHHSSFIIHHSVGCSITNQQSPITK